MERRDRPSAHRLHSKQLTGMAEVSCPPQPCWLHSGSHPVEINDWGSVEQSYWTVDIPRQVLPGVDHDGGQLTITEPPEYY